MSEIKEPVWAFIDDGVVTNTVVIFDLAVVEEHKARHEEVIRIDELPVVPGKNWSYNKTDGFRAPKPYESWVWNDDVDGWSAPVSMPELTYEGAVVGYEWNEETLSWDLPQWYVDETDKPEE